MQHQGRHVKRGKVRAEIGGPEGCDAIQRGLGAGLQRHLQRPVQHGIADAAAKDAIAVKDTQKGFQEGRAVGAQPVPDGLQIIRVNPDAPPAVLQHRHDR